MSDHTVDLDERRGRVIVGPAGLQGLLDSGKPLTVLDVRWALGRSDGRAQYESAHVPGAVYVDLQTELAGPASPAAGRHPLPGLDSLEDSARSWGVRRGVPVVVYDDVSGMSAARAWWLLRWAGVDDVRILDGGLSAWRARGGAVESGDVVVPESSIVLTPGHMPVVDADEAQRVAATGVLLDARAGERFRGEVEPVDPRAGHIPGAVSLPTAGTLDASGRTLTPEALLDRFVAAGVLSGAPHLASGEDQQLAVYCGSGVTASHQVAVLASLGIDAALYPGSWSQWSSDPERPAAVGA